MFKCSACPGVRPIVHSIGPSPCRVLLLGEMPSFEEDRRGEPFVGRTGYELNETYLTLCNLPRSEVHIDNVFRCSTPNYDNPTREQALACSNLHLGPLLDRVRPQVVVPMGAIACSLWPEINLALHHGRPLLGKWGSHNFVLWPSYHPSAGLHGTSYMIPLMADFDGLRKLLLSLDNGTFEWPVDPYPDPDYRVIHTLDDQVDYMAEGDGWFIENGKGFYPPGKNLACDTESLPNGDPYCVTFSHTSGTGRLIYVSDTESMRRLKNLLHVHQPHIIFHNYLHDVQVFDRLKLYIPSFTDTMVRAYNLCLGGGGDEEDQESRAGRGSLSLKILAYRHLNVEMTSFRDTVYPHSIPLMLDWLKGVQQTFCPSDPVSKCVCGHLTACHEIKGKLQRHSGRCSQCSCARHKKADPRLTDEERKWNLLHRKTSNLITALQNKQLADEYDELGIESDDDDAYPFVDPWKRIRQWHDHDREFLRQYVKPWPLASIEHVPEPELVRYAVRDADTTLRLYLYMKNLKPWLFL